MLAHGKPQTVNEKKEEWYATEEELRKLGALNADYEALVTEKFVFEACKDVDAIWKDLIQHASIRLVGDSSVQDAKRNLQAAGRIAIERLSLAIRYSQSCWAFVDADPTYFFAAGAGGGALAASGFAVSAGAALGSILASGAGASASPTLRPASFHWPCTGW